MRNVFSAPMLLGGNKPEKDGSNNSYRQLKGGVLLGEQCVL
jgi:hypothetical protein